MSIKVVELGNVRVQNRCPLRTQNQGNRHCYQRRRKTLQKQSLRQKLVWTWRVPCRKLASFGSTPLCSSQAFFLPMQNHVDLLPHAFIFSLLLECAFLVFNLPSPYQPPCLPWGSPLQLFSLLQLSCDANCLYTLYSFSQERYRPGALTTLTSGGQPYFNQL